MPKAATIEFGANVAGDPMKLAAETLATGTLFCTVAAARVPCMVVLEISAQDVKSASVVINMTSRI